MKKITMMTAAMLCSIAGFAQTTLWDGEKYELGSKGGCWDDGAPTVVENPNKDGINTSDKCLKFTMSNNNKVVKIPFREWIKPSFNGSKRVSLMIKKNVAENLQIEISDPTDGSENYWHKVAAWYDGNGTWQKVVFDFSANDAFDHPGVISITAQTSDVEGEQEVYIDNVVIEPATLVDGQALSSIADGSLTGFVHLTGAWMKGSCSNVDKGWAANNYNDFEVLRSKLSDKVTAIDMRGTITKEADVAPLTSANPNTLVYADAAYEHSNIVCNGAAAQVSLNDQYAFNAPEAFHATNVTLSRSLRNGINSFILPFNAEATELGATAVATYNKVDGNNVLFTKAANVAANTPFLTVEAAEASKLTFADKAVEATPDALGDNFVGVYAPQSTEGLYGINAEGNLQKGGADANIKAFHAYLTNVNDAKAISFDNTDGITATTTASNEMEGAVYDIAGRHVANSIAELKTNAKAKGIYIVNNKKILVK